MRDKIKQRKWQRENNKRRRQEWVIQNGPCAECGSTKDLQVDHKDPSTKVEHRIWSWTEERRNEELAKCQVLCEACHIKKTISEQVRSITHGTRSGYCRGCRCAQCVTRESDRVRDWKIRHNKIKMPL